MRGFRSESIKRILEMRLKRNDDAGKIDTMISRYYNIIRWSKMGATTLRLPDEKLKLIRAIAGYENVPLSKIFEEMADEYIERHKETLELLGIPGFVEECKEGLREIQAGGGKPIHDLDR